MLHPARIWFARLRSDRRIAVFGQDWRATCIRDLRLGEFLTSQRAYSTIARTTELISDRRSRPRLRVGWSVRLFRSSGLTIETRTEDLSCEGFACRIPEVISVGECMITILDVPKLFPDSNATQLKLRCEAVAVRVEAVPGGDGYIVACRILGYCVQTAAA